MQLVNAWTTKEKVILCRRNERGELQFQSRPVEYSALVDSPLPGATRDGSRWRVKFAGYDERKDWAAVNKGHYEADFSPVRRMITDNPKIEIQPPRWGAIDIETDSTMKIADALEGRARILSIAVSGPYGDKQFVLARANDYDEADMLREFWEWAKRYDLLVGWNSEGFDKPVIEERGKRIGNIWPDRRLLWLDAMLMYKRMSVQSQDSGEAKASFSLNNVAHQVLGYGKDDFDAAYTYEAWAAGGEQLEEMLKYNRQDSKLVYDILVKTGYFDSFLTICQTCRIFPSSHSLKPTPQIDAFLATFARARGQALPSRLEVDEGGVDEELEGALVLPPPKNAGVLENIHVADFAGLYPSIMRSFNISSDTKDSAGEISIPGSPVRFKDATEGLIPAFLDECTRLRAVWNTKKKAATPGTPEYIDADRRQMSFKTLSNSAYGITGNKYSRFFDLDLAGSVTAVGRWLIQLTNDEAKAAGLNPIYSDTDSIFVAGCSREQFADFVNHLNSVVFPAQLRAHGCSRNFVKLDFVETFSRVVFTAAKRYAGRFSLYAGKPVDTYQIEVKGLEYRRSDVNRLAREMQMQAVDLILRDGIDSAMAERFVLDWRDRIFQGKIELDDIVISKGVKEIDEYKGALPAQARVAAELRARGQRVYRARYVIVDAAVSPMVVIPADDYTGDFDRHHTWCNLVYPPTLRLFAAAFPNRDWNRWVVRRVSKKNKVLPGQTKLFG